MKKNAMCQSGCSNALEATATAAAAAHLSSFEPAYASGSGGGRFNWPPCKKMYAINSSYADCDVICRRGRNLISQDD